MEAGSCAVFCQEKSYVLGSIWIEGKRYIMSGKLCLQYFHNIY